MQEGDSVTPHTSTTVDKGDAGYDKALKNRHLQMIAIGAPRPSATTLSASPITRRP